MSAALTLRRRSSKFAPTMRGLGVILAGIALTMAACSPAAAPPSRRVYDIQVDAKATPFSLAAGLYFPHEVEAHAGDTIRFTAVDRGEIHTVTLGTLVDSALAAIAAAPSDSSRPTLESLKLPPVVIGSPPTELGASAVQPCFLPSGVMPSDACSVQQQRQPELSGTHSLFNSGYLPSGAVFALRLADTIKPGTYGFLCLLHGPEMSGRIVVVEQGRPVAEPAEVASRGAAELDAVVRGLRPAIEAASRGLPKGGVAAGVPARGLAHTQATVFEPAELSVRAGNAVRWKVDGFHTISFNAPQDAVGTVIRASDGTWTLNPRALAPERSPARPSSDGLTLDSGTWDGRGFRSSGLISSTGPEKVSYVVTFTEPGTYSYKCLLHPDMEGRIKVGD